MQRNPLILLALDESPFLQLGERALHSAGCKTAIAHDRQGLLRALQESTPSLLLIGERLRGESGLQLAAEQLERFPTLPILLYAEKDSSTTAKEVLLAGLSGYIFPPLHTDDIVAAVRRSLERAHALGDWVRGEVKRTTASLQRQVTDFDTIFNNIADGVIILDKQAHIILINQAAAQAFGVTIESVFDRPVAHALPHPDLQSLLGRSAEDGLKYHEINFDDERVFNAHFAPIPNIGSAITLQDISYLKELDRIKSDFVHTVSHDLRSPLTSVLGYAELIGRTGSLNEHQTEFMARLQSSIRDITSLVNDLLDLGRLEAGFDTRREIVHLENIIGYTLDVLGGQISAHNLTVRFDPDPNLPPLKANPLRLRQMLDNLIGNAIKYSPINGEIKVHVRAEEGQVILQVTDNGPGISPSDQPRIFEKFFRGENVPDDVPGSGLGLSIVKSIVDNHQGRIWVESTLGQGSAFFVVLPAYIPPTT
ncbi:MAG: response regulator [Anaerolineaceae bacterium]|nr:MAG: response regulator [Anaerolineaceae bacterium]